MSSPLLDIPTDPGVQLQLKRSRERLTAAPPRRERRAESVAAALFAVAAIALLAAGDLSSIPVATCLALVLAYAIALRVTFEVGAGYTVPTILVLVPMLFLVPAPLVPICVVAAQLLVYLGGVVRGKRHLTRAAVVLGQAWHAIGPALVFMYASPGSASWADLPVVLAAFAAYVIFDAAASLGIDHFGFGEPVRPLLRSSLWVYLVDLALLPIGLAVAIAAAGNVAPVLAVLPLCALLAVFAGERRRRVDHALELSQAYRGTAILLGDVVERDDHYTGSHSRDVVGAAVAVGRRMGLDDRRSRHLEFGCLLHDIGKIAIPKRILHKPGPLDEDEWALMRLHTIDGQRMLERVGGMLAEVGAVVRSSHERWDGGGYPDGLAGEAIPIESRICCACDAFSAMTTDRPYRHAMSFETAIEELRANAGTQFDPLVVDALVAELTASR